MAEIIQKGNTHKTAICKHCECYFSYKEYEIYKNGQYYYVNCPDCLGANIVNKKEDQ